MTDVEAQAWASSSMQTGKGDRVETGAAVLARNQHPQQPCRLGRLDGFVWESMVAIDLFGMRPHRSLRELAYGISEARVLGRQIQVH